MMVSIYFTKPNFNPKNLVFSLISFDKIIANTNIEHYLPSKANDEQRWRLLIQHCLSTLILTDFQCKQYYTAVQSMDLNIMNFL